VRAALRLRNALRLGNKAVGKHARAETVLRVAAAPGTRTRGILRFRNLSLQVALGRRGIAANKREGDGATPRGRFRLLRLWWRADRLPRPLTRLPVRRIGADDGWCEDPEDRRYNRAIKLSPGALGDRLKRDDHLYDLIIELDHNSRPRIKRHGSAVFMHVARPGFAPTAGCVALRKDDLLRLLTHVGINSWIEIR
jgi:L,D-peptidoglycan transpeptidase YkuD (ErfK/YbiS/YcfS/YnhG family)